MSPNIRRLRISVNQNKHSLRSVQQFESTVVEMDSRVLCGLARVADTLQAKLQKKMGSSCRSRLHFFISLEFAVFGVSSDGNENCAGNDEYECADDLRSFFPHCDIYVLDR